MSEEKTVPAMSDAELERMLAQAGAASVQVPAAAMWPSPAGRTSASRP